MVVSYFSSIKTLLFRSTFENCSFYLNSKTLSQNLGKYMPTKNIEIQFLNLWPSVIILIKN